MIPDSVSIIGGTGDLGQALTEHFAYHGINTVIGSRKEEKAERIAGELRDGVPEGSIEGKENLDAAAVSEFVVLTIPFWAHELILPEIATELEDKNILDTSVPLDDDAPDQYDVPSEGSAGFHVRERLPDSANLATGFHTVSSHSLDDPPSEPASDVFYCGDPEAKSLVENILDKLDFEGHDAGDLSRSGTLERLTPMVIHFNMQYDRSNLGIKLA